MRIRSRVPRPLNWDMSAIRRSRARRAPKIGAARRSPPRSPIPGGACRGVASPYRNIPSGTPYLCPFLSECCSQPPAPLGNLRRPTQPPLSVCRRPATPGHGPQPEPARCVSDASCKFHTLFLLLGDA